LSALDEAQRFAIALSVPLLAVAPVADGTRSLLWQAVISLVAVVLVRGLVYATIRRARGRGLTERTLIAGTGHVGIELAHVLSAHAEYGLDVVGFVGAPFPNLPGPLLADVAHLDDIITEQGIRRVLVAFGPTRESELVGVLRTAVLRDVEVHVVPRFFEVGVAPRGPDVDDLWGIPVYRVRQAALRAGAWRFKRAIDIIAASVLLLVTAPIMALASLLVKLSGRGPVLFRQPRIGQHGTEFEVLKFRTLPVDYTAGAAWNAWDVEYSNPIGRWLRRLSIDELPQLWNILRGDMSLVGPRPELGHFVEQFSQSVYGYGDRHRLPVGLTGWAQVHGLRGATSLRERARFDNQYIEHWSLWRDIVIIVRTGGAFFREPHPDAPPEPVLRNASAPESSSPNGAEVM
jgi:exopolysaccharide biosynthesis polyprenyl glycosylphosphotransferase